MLIDSAPDTFAAKTRQISYAGTKWLSNCAQKWETAVSLHERHNVLDLSAIEFIPLYEWVITTTLLAKLLSFPNVSSVQIDVLGAKKDELLTPERLIALEARQELSPTDLSKVAESRRAYALAGFLESLGTINALNFANDFTVHGGSQGRVGYRWLGDKDALLRRFYSNSSGRQTVVLPLTRIESKENCLSFLDDGRISVWREAMQRRFVRSPLFEFDELWRIFCHELSVNIWEHSGTAGFISGRVVNPFDENMELLPWCKFAYPAHIVPLLSHMKSGFLELCVSDAGKGFLDSLGPTFRNKSGTDPASAIQASDVLAFAFDEIGTCKGKDDSWATSRHALGRILQMVARYGGGLTLRSSGAEIGFSTTGGAFERIPNHLGFRPQHISNHAYDLPGSHFQLILPLIPLGGQSEFKGRKSVLLNALPQGFHVDTNHARGHLIPLMEALDAEQPCIGADQLHTFKQKVEVLARRLLEEHSHTEPIVLDFSDLKWTAAQFETLLFLLQNILETRPVLLVEIDPRLAQEVIDLERESAPTKLTATVVGSSIGASGQFLGEVTEKVFMDSFRLVHATLLGLDIHGQRYIFGLPDRACEPLLLSLISEPRSLNDLCAELPEHASAIRGILNHINPLFHQKGGKWMSVWGQKQLAIEAARVMSKHFDSLAKRCEAWRGEPDIDSHHTTSKDSTKPSSTQKNYFNLPWQDEWVDRFFECSRILSRQRYADEAAQRLLYRLTKGLSLINRSIDEVAVLACVTAPAILLATALHRCWPTEERPAIADLGPYLMLDPDGGNLPDLPSNGPIVIVQDVSDKGRITGPLIQWFKERGKSILCVLSLVQLERNPSRTQPSDHSSYEVFSISEGWEKPQEGTIRHAMIRLQRPTSCIPPSDFPDTQLYWVEPRTLRPFRFSVLRGFQRSAKTGGPNARTLFEELGSPRLLNAGHYVYGDRHYSIAIDIQATLEGSVGDIIANWLAEICQGITGPTNTWASKRGATLHGEVTAVLMPLHSRIHYIWPKVTTLLAQRGRRQPMWLLDATLFLGHGPNYRLPKQFEDQIRKTAKSVASGKGKPMRILILDDAIHSAQTASTILDSISSAIARSLRSGDRPELSTTNVQSAIEWIRYFSVFNQLPHAQNNHWHNLRSVGQDVEIPFVFEEFAHLPGIPTFAAGNCPICADRVRLEVLISSAERRGAYGAADWAKRRMDTLAPRAVETHPNALGTYVHLPRGIDVLPRSVTGTSANENRNYYSVDLAIWRFHELMYYSRPPGDILLALRGTNAWPLKDESPFVAEYERFRWTVLVWCLRNWPRLVASGARTKFLACVLREVRMDTSLVQPLFEGLAAHHKDEYVQRILVFSLKWLSQLEHKRGDDDPKEPKRGDRRWRLDQALTLFLLNLPSRELSSFVIVENHRHRTTCEILKLLSNLSKETGSEGPAFLTNLYVMLSRPSRQADPRWALRTAAEALFRGRDPKDFAVSSHRLLPALLKEIRDHPEVIESRMLALGSLAQFLAALDDLAPYSNEIAIEAHGVKERGMCVLRWLKINEDDSAVERLPPELPQLMDDLLLESSFCKAFNRIFHEEVGDLYTHFQTHLAQKELNSSAKLQFEYRVDPSASKHRILIHVHRLYHFLANWAIDPAVEHPGKRSKIEVYVRQADIGSGKLCFRILSSFAPLQITNERTIHGRHYESESSMLKIFGAHLADAWESPSDVENSDGFLAAFELVVPAGFTPKPNAYGI